MARQEARISQLNAGRMAIGIGITVVSVAIAVVAASTVSTTIVGTVLIVAGAILVVVGTILLLILFIDVRILEVLAVHVPLNVYEGGFLERHVGVVKLVNPRVGHCFEELALELFLTETSVSVGSTW